MHKSEKQFHTLSYQNDVGRFVKYKDASYFYIPVDFF